MKVRLGYVAISKTLEDTTSSSTISYTNYKKKEDSIQKLQEITLSNLQDLEKIITYNIANHIHFYRITSKLVPLATHQDVPFDYLTPNLKLFQKIGNKIKEANMRVDVHPDQFTVLNSTNQKVRENTLEILKYHTTILEAMQIPNPRILLHVGSSVFGKEPSMKRFIHQFSTLPTNIQKMIAIENDDKIFTIEDVLFISKQINIPVVLDYHHFLCNHKEQDITIFLEDILKSWKEEIPKMHFSSPKSKLKKEFRSHSEYIEGEKFIQFLETIKSKIKEVDIMLEAKAKDEALFRLTRYLKYKTNYRFIDETTFEV